MANDFFLLGIKTAPRPNEPGYVEVNPVWSGVDRPITHGWVVTRTVAERLKRALEAGVVYDNLHVKTDVYGDTYVAGSSRVMAKYANADLKKLGY